MKHGLKLRKLQRTPSHRYALLRNLVSALLHHESIKTTLPKAKETARMAEKIITLGKKGNDPARRAAMAFLMPSHSYNPSERPQGPIPPPRPSGYPSSSSSSSSSSTPEDPETFEPPTTLLPKLFSTLSERYASRSGGYTRIHRFGRRPGDNAPHAILELVDGPKDLKFEMVSRAVGREAAVAGVSMESGGAAGRIEEMEGLREGTQLAVQKVLQFRGEDGQREMRQKAAEWANVLRAEEKAYNGHRRQKAFLANKEWSEVARTPAPHEGRRYIAGERMSGMQIAHTGLGLARGALGRRQRLDTLDRAPRYINEQSL